MGATLILSVIVGAVVGAVLGALGVSGGAREGGIAGLVELIATLFLTFLIGGYVAGRMASRSGLKHGLFVPLLALSYNFGYGGWMAVYRDEGGQPGDVIGVAPLQEGVNTDVTVPLSEPLGTSQKLYAVIHANDPAGDTYTFPDSDPPVKEGGEPVVEAFSYTVGSLAAGESVPDTGGPEIVALLPVVGGLVLMLGGLVLRWRAVDRG